MLQVMFDDLIWSKYAEVKSLSSRFPLGQVLITTGALEALNIAGDKASEFLTRHQSGDWGDVSGDDKAENDFSLEKGFRLLSAYRTSLSEKIWIITEADRSATTILLPSEY